MISSIGTARLAACALALTGLATIAPAHATTFATLYVFKGGSDGAQPSGALVRDAADNVYGTTASGGKDALGTVFKLAPDGTETVLHSFKGGNDGWYPSGQLARNKRGDLYGTTVEGGPGNYGTIFKIKPDGKKTVLHGFSSIDGSSPEGGVILDSAGNLYGTTSFGGDGGGGTVFKLAPDGTLTTLHAFTGFGDGERPYAGLIMDTSGNLYGTTQLGGQDINCNENQGCGTVFRVAPDGTTTILYSFLGQQGPNDGNEPMGGLVMDASGNLYGTTSQGGADNGGTVFEITTADKEQILYSFGSNSADGFFPEAGLVRDDASNLYGTTDSGANSGCQNGVGCGNVFQISPGGSETILHVFTGGRDGGITDAGLIVGISGYLYGTASDGGGKSGSGTIFKVKE